MNTIFFVLMCACSLVAIGAVLFGLLSMFVDFSWETNDMTFKIGMTGAVLGVIFMVPFLITLPSIPLSRGIVADKRHEVRTTMIMTGKVMVPSRTEHWELVSETGATCSIPSQSYDQYRVGDAVVCEWN